MTGTAPKALGKGAGGPQHPQHPWVMLEGGGQGDHVEGTTAPKGGAQGVPVPPAPGDGAGGCWARSTPSTGKDAPVAPMGGGQGHRGVTEPSTQGGGLVGWGSAPPGKPPPSSPCVTPAGLGSFTETSCGEGKPRHGGTRAPAGRGGSLQGAAPSRKEKGVKKHPTDAFATIPQPHGLVPVLPPFPLWFWGKKIKIAFSGFFFPYPVICRHRAAGPARA